MSAVPSRIGPYRVERELARGGMGIVYLARDTRLDRPAALKALPEDFLSDPDRLLRFEREAKVLAALSHPNIAGIYGVEEFEGRRYLALEYVEGETLAQRLARGPLDLEDAVAICVQIAAGIEAAHEGGIIHRDLKPGNVMITPQDEVKVVDFGLAKGKVAEVEERAPESPAAPDSPTSADSPVLPRSPAVGSPMTLPGVILGTAAYLSPEQARGKPVDRRTDIWSFGCVLYECLTGRRAFEGASVPEVIGRILRGEVDWGRLPAGTPSRLRELLERCFEKDPKRRLRDMGDARLALEEIREGKAVPAGTGTEGGTRVVPGPRPLLSHMIPAVVALLLVGVAAAIALWITLGPERGAPSSSRAVRRFSISLPPEVRWKSLQGPGYFAFTGVAISPDGRFLITVGTPRTRLGEPTARPRLYRRRLDAERFEPVEGSEGATGFLMSPDGAWIYFVAPMTERTAEFQLMKVSMAGVTAPVTLAKWDPTWDDWVTLEGGDLLVTRGGSSEFFRVHSAGGAPSAPIKLVLPTGVDFGGFYREGLPADRGVLVGLVSKVDGAQKGGVGVLDPRTGKVKVLVAEGGRASYSPTGHLLFTRRSTLLAAPFDLKRLEVRGEPVAVADGLRSEIDVDYNADFSFSRDGTLLYQPGGIVGEHRRLIVVDAQGRVTEWSPERALFNWSVNANPTGDRAACLISPHRGFWISDRGKAVAQRVFVPPTATECSWPEFSPDGRQIAFTLYGDSLKSGIYLMASDGSGRPRQICRPIPPTWFGKIAWQGDGSALLGSLWRTGFDFDVVRIPIQPASTPPPPGVPLIATPGYKEYRATSSPDGRWIAYASNETGREEIYVVACSGSGSIGPARMVSAGGGTDPCWSRDGREVYYRSPQRNLMAVPVTFQPALAVGPPVPRWDLDQLRVIDDGGSPYDALPGGRIIAIQRGEEEGEVTRIEVVVNFFEEMKQKMRVAGKL